MKKSRLIALSLSLIMLISALFAFTVPTGAAGEEKEQSGFFERADKDASTYAYSIAVIGDTQSLSDSDYDNRNNDNYVKRMDTLYSWVQNNIEAKKIGLVMGLGDIVENWQHPLDYSDYLGTELGNQSIWEWENATRIFNTYLDGENGVNVPYTLVRGNHDSANAYNAFVTSENMSAYREQFASDNAGFYVDSNGVIKYDNSYMKLTLGTTKWLVMTLDYGITERELDWAGDVIAANPDYRVILSMHSYLYHDKTIDGEGDTQSTAFPNPNWDYTMDMRGNNKTDENPEGPVYNPDGIWERLVSRHSNIEIVLSGHIPNSATQMSQLVGDNGNTVTQILVDPQSMDLPANNTSGCGMVAMLYFNEDGTLQDSQWDENTIDLEWYSTIKQKYFKEANQFTIDVNLYDGGIKTENYGTIPAKYADTEKYPFVTFGYDRDIDEYFFLGAYSSWSDSSTGAYPALSAISGAAKKVPAYVLLRRDYTSEISKSYAMGKLTLMEVNLDLNGFTVTTGNNAFFSTNLGTANAKTTLNVFGKEGSKILNGSGYRAFVTLGATTSGVGASFTYNFSGITFGFAEGTTTTKLVAETFDMASSNNSHITISQSLNFENCTFDLKTNKPSNSVVLFKLNESVGEEFNVCSTGVKVDGGKIIANDMTSVEICKKNANDTITFNEGKSGEYTTFELSSGAAAPTEALKNSLGEDLEYVSRGNGVYGLEKATEKRGVIDVWLIGGQSNAAGYGSDGLTDAKYDSRYTNGFDNILYYGAGDNNAKDSFVPLTVGLGNKATSVGAEVGIAKMLGDTDTMNAVIKLGRGASYLYPNTTASASQNYGTWTSPTYIKTHGIDTDGTLIGALYNDFIETVADAIAILKAQGYTPVIRGMWWMQGEAESSDATTAAAYPELLECLINDLRRDIEAACGVESSDMPFVAGNILRNPAKDADGNFVYSQPAFLADINAAQASVAKKLNNVYTVATAHLPQIDNWHFTADAQQYLGEQFVKNVVYSSGKYSVSIDGIAAEGTGFGAYAPGETVTVTVSGRDGWLVKKAYYTISGATPIEIAVASGNVTYTFTMPTSDVTISVDTEDTGAVSTKYGSIPAVFTDAQKYPFVLFKNGEFYAAYGNWNEILDKGAQIFITDPAGSKKATLLLRRDYNTTEQGASSQGLFTIEGHIDFDLGGYTVTRGEYHLFQVMAKKESAKATLTSFNVYNGTILTAKSVPIAINTNTAAKADDHFTFTFTGVTFGYADGSASAALVMDTYANGTYDTKLSITFNGCTFDTKTNMPANKNVCIFDAEENEGSLKSADITVNGGKVIIGDSTKVTFAKLGGSDKLFFGKGENGAYPTFNLESSTAPTDIYSTKDGEYLRFSAGTPEANGTYTYTLSVANVETTKDYGVIDNTLYPASQYPFALFQKQSDGTYIFKNAYKTYYDFLLDLCIDPVSVESVLYLRADYTISTASGDIKSVTYNGKTYNNIDRYFYYLKAPLTIDLNGKTLTRDNLHSLQMMGNGTSVTITVKNGTLHTAAGTMIPFNNTGTKTETTVLNFEGVTFTTANVQYPFIDSYTGGSADTTTTAYVTFTDCVIDISNLDRASGSKATLFDLNDDKNWINIHVTFIGGKFITGAKGFTNVNLFSANGENDSFTFGKNADGKYTEFSVKKGLAAPSYSFVSNNGTELKLFADFSVLTSATAETTHNTYFLDETVKISEYDNLPKSLTGYTFLVFDSAKTAFVGYNTWYDIWQNIWTLRNADTIIVLMLKDYDTDNCAGSSQDVFAAKNMIVDLNGHTLTRGSKHVFQLYEKGTNATYTPNITVKNGTICSKKDYGTLMYFNSSASAKNVSLSFNFTFEGVTFTATDTYTGRLVAETHATNGVNGISATLTFNGCDFIVKNKVDAVFTLNDTNGKYSIDVTINGGSITFEKSAPIAKLGENDSLTFGKLNGAYTTVNVKSGVDAANGAYATTEGVDCVFVKISENDGYVNYSLYPEVMAGYKIKTSITLWSNFVYNIYVPKANFNSAMVNGNIAEYTEVEVGGVWYYLIKVDLPAGETLRDIALTVTLNSGNTTVDANWTLSVFNYTKSVLAGEFNDTTKTLMKDMLVYASAAHTYFKNTEAVAEKLAEIKALLGDYAATLPTGEAKKPEGNTYFTDVAVYLGEVPSFRFYLASGYTASDFTFKVGNRTVEAIAGEGYVEIVMYAYMMLDDVTFTVKGTNVAETYNLYSYYEYALKQNNANLVAIVEALMKYSVSANAYRNSVINK